MANCLCTHKKAIWVFIFPIECYSHIHHVPHPPTLCSDNRTNAKWGDMSQIMIWKMAFHTTLSQVSVGVCFGENNLIITFITKIMLQKVYDKIYKTFPKSWLSLWYIMWYFSKSSFNGYLWIMSLIARFMGPIWGRQDPGGPHVGPMKLAIWGFIPITGQIISLGSLNIYPVMQHISYLW